MLLFVLPLPLLLKAVVSLWGGHLEALLSNGIAYGLFLLGAIFMRRGLIEEACYLMRPLAHHRVPPFKAGAAAMIGIATALTAFAAVGHTLVIALLFGAGAAAGMVMYYGLDPKRPAPPIADHNMASMNWLPP